MGVQGGDQHQAALQVFSHFGGIHFQACDAVLLEVAATVCQQLDGLQQVVNDHRFVHVQLQVTLAGSKTDGYVVAHHLARQHRQRFALSGVDLAGHDRASRLVGWQFDFSQPRARSRTQQAQVIGQFHQGHGQGFEGARQVGQGFVTRQGGKLVGCRDKRQAGQRRQFSRNRLGKAVGCIQAGAHRSAALRQLVDGGQGGVDAALRVIELRYKCRHFLTKGDGCGIHQVSAAGFDLFHVASRQLGQPPCQLTDRRQ